MAYEIRELSGSLFKNEKKTEEKHPQMQGSCLIEGVEYWVSAWTKEGAKGRWQSLAFKRKDAKPDAKPASIEQMDDDIPFN
tara:strand:+ start:150 stop:392 length:243 start_codon:yes stop_codon:yes gene_type:complete